MLRLFLIWILIYGQIGHAQSPSEVLTQKTTEISQHQKIKIINTFFLNLNNQSSKNLISMFEPNAPAPLGDVGGNAETFVAYHTNREIIKRWGKTSYKIIEIVFKSGDGTNTEWAKVSFESSNKELGTSTRSAAFFFKGSKISMLLMD